MREPPVLEGAVHVRFMQVFEALTTVGGAGTPGKAEILET